MLLLGMVVCSEITRLYVSLECLLFFLFSCLPVSCCSPVCLFLVVLLSACLLFSCLPVSCCSPVCLSLVVLLSACLLLFSCLPVSCCSPVCLSRVVSCISLSSLQTVLHNWQVSFTAHDAQHASVAVSISIFLVPSCSLSFCVLTDSKKTVFLF